MAELSANTVWLKLVVGNNTVQQFVGGGEFRFSASTTLAVRIGVYQTAETPYEINDIVSLSMEVKELINGAPPPADADALMSKTVNAAGFAATAITHADFKLLAAYHAEFSFPTAETVVGAGKYHVVWSAVTSSGAIITIATGKVTIEEDGTGDIATADTIPGSLTAQTAATTYLAQAAVRGYVPFTFPGRLAIGQKRGYFKAAVDVRIVGILIDTVDGLAGADLAAKVIDEADADQVAAQTIVTDGASYGQILFGSALSLSAGDEILLELTAIGTTTPGEFLGGSWITQPLTQS